MLRYLTTEEVAELTRATPSTVRHWRQVGRGPASARVGKRVLYREADVRVWLDSLFAADPSSEDAAAPGS